MPNAMSFRRECTAQIRTVLESLRLYTTVMEAGRRIRESVDIMHAKGPKHGTDADWLDDAWFMLTEEQQKGADPGLEDLEEYRGVSHPCTP